VCERKLARGTRCAVVVGHSGVNFIYTGRARTSTMHMRSRAARVISGRARPPAGAASDAERAASARALSDMVGPSRSRAVSAARAERDDGHGRLCSDSGS